MLPTANPNGEVPSRRAAEWIVAVAQEGDRAAFALLFNRFAPKVKGYCLRMGMTAQAAEELAEETLAAVWRCADQFDPASVSAWGWIFTMARNVSMVRVRREPHPDALRPLDEPELRAFEEFGTMDVPPARLRAAIDGLPADQCEVLSLAFFEGSSHAEIANRLGLSLGTVKSRIRRAAACLRTVLETIA